jgi:cytosine/adenosine deaminase-related metal-dependent hydrolase
VEWTPYHDPLQALVYSASSASIEQTWVNGVPCYSEGRVHGVDEPALRRKARALAAAAVERAGLHREGVATTTTLYDTGN